MLKRQKKHDADARSGFTKIARPLLSGVVPRTRLFRMLDDAGKTTPIIWIAAPAGSGKTTLVASYLQARKSQTVWYRVDTGDNDVAAFFYYLGLALKTAAPRFRRPLPLLTSEYSGSLPTFAANYFSDLFDRLPSPGTLVLDDFQEASNSQFYELLGRGLVEIPRGMQVIVLSREEPPTLFLQAVTSARLTRLGWEDLKLTHLESAEIVKLRTRDGHSSQATDLLHARTQGWVAGVVLLTEQGVIPEEMVPTPSVTNSIFDYFAHQIFRRAEPDVREFLLQTAYLPRITVSIARALTGKASSEAILNDLTRRNYFTVADAEGGYVYHPLFRVFLDNRVCALYTPEEISRLKRRSAELLEADGDVEIAVSLLQQAQEWTEALRLIKASAATLVQQGRTQTLQAWLHALPSEICESDPWALYWLGVCRLAFTPAQARVDFERAFALFEKRDDVSALYMVWMRIIESFLFELNDLTAMHRWLDKYAELKRVSGRPAPGVENASVFAYVSSLTFARSDHPDLAIYVEHAEHLLRRETDQDRRIPRATVLVHYYLWMGEIHKVENLIGHLAKNVSKNRVLEQILFLSWRAWHAAVTCAPDSLQLLTAGLALADESGIHMGDSWLLGHGILGQLYVGKADIARTLLLRLSSLSKNGQIKQAFYSHSASMVALHEGNTQRAMEEARVALDLAKAGGLSAGTLAFLICLAFVSVRQGDVDGARALLAEARPRAVALRSKLYLFHCALCEADIHRLQGEQALAVRALKEALLLAKENGLVTPGYCARDTAALLYTMALDNDIQSDYVRHVIAKTRLPPPPKGCSDRWPWPVRIYTLGQFAVHKEGDPIVFSGQAPQKPMQLLRALIAFGGHNVSAAKLAQALWPDTDGDMGEHSVETTLHRLRRLIGEECVVRQGHQLSLNPSYCWSDSWVVERIFDEHGTISPEQATLLLKFYKGTFLPEEDAPWAVTQREGLHSKYLRSLLSYGSTLEAAGRWRDAAAVYRQMIEIDSSTEELYVRLMRCYLHLNLTAEALATYQCCANALKNFLQIDPSPRLLELRAQIKGSLV